MSIGIHPKWKIQMENQPSAANSSNEVLFQGLKRLDSTAIRQLSEKLSCCIKSITRIYLLPKEDIEELKNDAIVITLKKITEGEFIYQGPHPVAFTIVVFKGLLNNRLRKKNRNTVSMEFLEETVSFDPEQYFIRKETEKIIAEVLQELGEKCEQIIRLRYFDCLQDREVIDRKLTEYQTVNSLKSKRSQCLKKLAILLKRRGISLHGFLK